MLLNSIPGESIPHGRGLRQGDPLSPPLFILAIDPLQRLLQLEMEAGLLSRICRNPSTLRTSLYANDAVLFVKPIKEDINTLARLLEFFWRSHQLAMQPPEVHSGTNKMYRP